MVAEALHWVPMAGSADLLRSVRAGGGAAAAAARELVRRAQTGALAPAELREVQKAANSPELRDVFRGVAKEAGALTGGGELVFRDVESLQPDTARLTDARALPERFMSDLTLVRAALLEHPGMAGQQQAERLFTFFETYAARFNELANGMANDARPLTEAEWGKALLQFEKVLTRAKFGELTTGDGRTGLEAALQMLEARTREVHVQARPAAVDAPTWKDNAERTLRTEVDRERRAVAFDSSHAPVTPQLRTTGSRVDEAEKKAGARRQRGKDGVLGGRMVWNVLHLLRGEDLDDVARKDAMTQLAVAAGLILCLGGILVGILVWM